MADQPRTPVQSRRLHVVFLHLVCVAIVPRKKSLAVSLSLAIQRQLVQEICNVCRCIVTFGDEGLAGENNRAIWQAKQPAVSNKHF